MGLYIYSQDILQISCTALCISSTTLPSLQYLNLYMYSSVYPYVCVVFMHAMHTYLPVCMFKSGFHLQSAD